MRILDDRREALMERERTLLREVGEFLVSFGAPDEDVGIARGALEDLEELFLLVVVGEFNSGKSAFINALLGAELSEEGVTPTTDRITLLRFGDEPATRERGVGVVEKAYPNEFLREISVVDTPGTNAIIREHEKLSRGFVPRSDLVLFVTSSDRPFTESERGYLEIIRDWGKKVILIVNKADLLRGEEDVEKIRRFVEEGVRSALGLQPPVFFVSAALARKAKAADSGLERDALLNASGFPKLEGYVTDLLDEEGRVRLKLESPLGVVERLLARYGATVEERLGLLKDDFETSERVEEELRLYVEDVRRDFEARVAEIENIVLEMNERGDRWFDENVRLRNIQDLARREKIEEQFRREVVADTEGLINERVDELVDWMVERNLKQWRQIVDFVERRRRARYDESLVGGIGDNFDYNRGRVLQSVARNAQEVVRNYDRERESREVSLSIQNAVTQTAVVSLGAVGIGTAVVLLFTTRFLDVTGILAAGILAGLGLFIIPNRRRRARDEFREGTEELRTRLVEVVRRQFEAELSRSVEGMREAIAPYTRFVRAEHGRMTEARARIAEHRGEISALRAEISSPGSKPLPG
jgi:GTP-binding protein EngB required for normal cell division